MNKVYVPRKSFVEQQDDFMQRAKDVGAVPVEAPCTKCQEPCVLDENHLKALMPSDEIVCYDCSELSPADLFQQWIKDEIRRGAVIDEILIDMVLGALEDVIGRGTCFSFLAAAVTQGVKSRPGKYKDEFATYVRQIVFLNLSAQTEAEKAELERRQLRKEA